MLTSSSCLGRHGFIMALAILTATHWNTLEDRVDHIIGCTICLSPGREDRRLRVTMFLLLGALCLGGLGRDEVLGWDAVRPRFLGVDRLERRAVQIVLGVHRRVAQRKTAGARQAATDELSVASRGACTYWFVAQTAAFRASTVTGTLTATRGGRGVVVMQVEQVRSDDLSETVDHKAVRKRRNVVLLGTAKESHGDAEFDCSVGLATI